MLLLTTNEFSAASTPTRGVRSLNLCAFMVLTLMVSEANVTNFVQFHYPGAYMAGTGETCASTYRLPLHSIFGKCDLVAKVVY